MNRERSGCLGRMSASFIAGQRLAMYLRGAVGVTSEFSCISRRNRSGLIYIPGLENFALPGKEEKEMVQQALAGVGMEKFSKRLIGKQP